MVHVAVGAGDHEPVASWLLTDKYDRPFRDMTSNGRHAIAHQIRLDPTDPNNGYKSAHLSGEYTSNIELPNADGGLSLDSFTFVTDVKPDGVKWDEAPIFGWDPEVGYSMPMLSYISLS